MTASVVSQLVEFSHQFDPHNVSISSSLHHLIPNLSPSVDLLTIYQQIWQDLKVVDYDEDDDSPDFELLKDNLDWFLRDDFELFKIDQDLPLKIEPINDLYDPQRCQIDLFKITLNHNLILTISSDQQFNLSISSYQIKLLKTDSGRGFIDKNHISELSLKRLKRSQQTINYATKLLENINQNGFSLTTEYHFKLLLLKSHY